MAKDAELETLKTELRVAVQKVQARYIEMHKDDPDYRKVQRATKNLITRIINGTS